MPKIKELKIKGKSIIKITVAANDTPYSAFHKYYIRVNDSDTFMPNNVLEKFFRNKEFDYSKWENADSGHTIDDVDEELLITYISEANNRGRINYLYKDAENVLDKLHLLYKHDKSHLNNAGFYLFTKTKPLLLKLACYPSDDRIKFSDIKQFKGNIFECINEGIKYISNNIRWSASINGAKRVEVPEIPIEAIREIVVNSFAHMKVNNVSAHEIYITPDRIHVYNPGSLIPGTNPKMFANHEQGSMIRNPLIAQALYYNGTIDAFGTGFSRVFNLCKGMKFNFFDNEFGFSFEFLRSENDKNLKYQDGVYSINKIIDDRIKSMYILPQTIEDYFLTRDNARKLKASTVEVYSIIIKDPYISVDRISDRINKSNATINRSIKELKNLGLIKRIGSNKNGHWLVV